MGTDAERKAVRARLAKRRASLKEINTAWTHVRKLMEGYGHAASQPSKLEFGKKMERLMRRYPDRIAYVRVDDDMHASSDLWVIKFFCADASLDREYWGTSLVFVGQCDGKQPVEMFLYPQAMRELLGVAKEIESMQRKLNRGKMGV